MLTKNEEKTIKLIYDDYNISLRKIVADLDLAGVASATYIINSLEKKGYIKRVGITTSKKYQLTQKSLDICEIQIDSKDKYSNPIVAIPSFISSDSLIGGVSTCVTNHTDFHDLSFSDIQLGGTGDVNIKELVNKNIF